MTASRPAPTRILSVLSGAALSAGLIFSAAPAAHAGGDHGKAEFRHRNSGSEARAEWPQGRSQSDPDGDSNGGKDKPGFRGGFDDDRDGNNGCGNDTDREDDNNGNCGRDRDRSEAEVQAVVTPAVTAVKAQVVVTRAPAADAPAEVAGIVETAAPADTTTTTAPETTSTTVPTEVMGISETAPDALARTGAGVGVLALAAGLCLGGGRLLNGLKRRLDS